MEEQQEYHLEEEALAVLSLFPVRGCALAAPSLPEYARLVEALSCGLCREVLFSPVALRCSHRFCSDCLARYLRAQNRTCPNCQVLIPASPQLRTDAALEAFITAAFGDARRLSKRLREAAQDGLELRRAESQAEPRPRQITEEAATAAPSFAGVSGLTSLSALRRTKTADEEQRAKKRPSEKKIKGGAAGESERENTPTRRSKLAAELREIKRENADPVPERKKRRSVMVIEIDSSEQVDVQEIQREEFQQQDERAESRGEDSLPLPAGRLAPSISIIPEVSEMDSARKIVSMRDLQEDPRIEQHQREEKQEQREEQSRREGEVEGGMEEEAAEEIAAGEGEPMMEDEPVVPAQVLAGREALLQQFGANFLTKILELSEFPIFMRVAIAPHPLNPFAPPSSFSQLKLLARSTAHSVVCVIADDLNINREAVRLFVSEDQGGFIEVSASTKLQEVNGRFWRSAGGFEIVEFGEYDGPLRQASARMEQRFAAAWQNRILYYFVDFNKIS